MRYDRGGSVATLQVRIEMAESLQNAQDMESLGTVLGSQLRHTRAQSSLDFILHDNPFSGPVVHYLYTCCTLGSIGLLQSV